MQKPYATRIFWVFGAVSWEMQKQPLGVLALDNLFQIPALRAHLVLSTKVYKSFDANLMTLGKVEYFFLFLHKNQGKRI